MKVLFGISLALALVIGTIFFIPSNTNEDKVKDEIVNSSSYIPINKEYNFTKDHHLFIEGIGFKDNQKDRPTVLYSSNLLDIEGWEISLEGIFPPITGGGGTTGRETFHTVEKVEDELILKVVFLSPNLTRDEYEITLNLKN